MSMSTTEYWRGRAFAYVTIFSLLRGPKWEQQLVAMRREKEVSRRLLLTTTAGELVELRARLHRLERRNYLETRLTTDDNRAYNLTATPVATLRLHSPEVVALENILRTPLVDRTQLMCGPVFRDALAFYNAEEELLDVLNICFECSVMQTQTGQEIEADTTIYPKLKHWFQQLGYPVHPQS